MTKITSVNCQGHYFAPNRAIMSLWRNGDFTVKDMKITTNTLELQQF